jgi:hypothetical protein
VIGGFITGGVGIGEESNEIVLVVSTPITLNGIGTHGFA